MIRLLYFALILFILFDTSNGLINGNLSGIASGRSLNGYTITYKDNPIEFFIDMVTRIGAIALLVFLLRHKSEKD